MVTPYLDIDLGGGCIHRYFPELVEEIDLVWHRDYEDRSIKVMQSDKWMFQFDNEMPFELSKDSEVFIPAMTYHRIIKGKGPLEILIQETSQITQIDK